jgi:phosphoenolpyruvate synthase/pyruvate phosphate dikinase
MNLAIPLDQIRNEDRDRVGGKAFSLAIMALARETVSDEIGYDSDYYMEYN